MCDLTLSGVSNGKILKTFLSVFVCAVIAVGCKLRGSVRKLCGPQKPHYLMSGNTRHV